jgi:hypothetical protein
VAPGGIEMRRSISSEVIAADRGSQETRVSTDGTPVHIHPASTPALTFAKVAACAWDDALGVPPKIWERQTCQNKLRLVSGWRGLGIGASMVGCMIVLRLRLSRNLKHDPCRGRWLPVTPSRLLMFMPFPKILRIVSERFQFFASCFCQCGHRKRRREALSGVIVDVICQDLVRTKFADNGAESRKAMYGLVLVG